MPKKNCFSALIDQDISRFRRVHHSATNYMAGFRFRKDVTATNVVGAGANALGYLGGVAGAASVAGTAVGTAIAATGFAIAVSGPQAALIGAVIGLGMLARGAYSNREAAHKKLSQYVWNLIDDTPPEKELNTMDALQDAADAALTLMTDGVMQMRQLGAKLSAAQARFDALNREIEEKVKFLSERRDFYQRFYEIEHMPFEVAKMGYGVHKDKAASWLKGLWDRETKPGGAIFDYVRRCAHVGNYLQAPHVVALSMRETINAGSVTGVSQPDYFLGLSKVTNFRNTFTRLDEVFHKFGIV